MCFHQSSKTKITIPSSNTWCDIRLDDYITVPGFGVSGVILQIVNTDADTSYQVGIRKKGSSDVLLNSLMYSRQTCAMMGVDDDRKFQVYVGNKTYIEIYIVGYTDTRAVFRDNAVSRFASTYNSWLDVNCASYAPSAIAGIFLMLGRTTSYAFGLRCKGSTDDRHTDVWGANCLTPIVGLDGDQKAQQYVGSTYHKLYLIGYILSGAVFNTDATDISLASSGSYADLTALPPGYGGGMAIIEISGNTGSVDIRRKGETLALYDIARHTWMFVGTDQTGVAEAKISTTNMDFFLIGYSQPDTTRRLGGAGIGSCMVL